MIDRLSLGVVEPPGGWPRFSVPSPVEDRFWDLVARLPADVEVDVVGRGYHNQGWAYLEVEVRAWSDGRACEVADELSFEITAAFQMLSREEMT